MENILYFLNQPNIALIKIFQLFTIIFKVDISYRILNAFFKSKLNIKDELIYLFFMILANTVILISIPLVYSSFISLIFSVLILKFILKIDLIPSLVASIAPISIVITVKSLLVKVLSPELNYNETVTIPINFILIFVTSYIILYITFFVLKKLKLSLEGLIPLSKKQKILFIFNLLVYIQIVYVQIYLMEYYENSIPFYLVSMNFLGMNAFFVVNIYFGLLKTSLVASNESLQAEILYNQSLQTLYDNLRYFKHDFNNIIQSLGGFIVTKDYNGLEEYYDTLLQESRSSTSLSCLSPTILNNPAIQNIVSVKYFKAQDLGIIFDIEVLLNLNKLDIDIYDLSRILGILLDNAIEAASICERNKKHIIFQVYHNKNKNLDLVIIKNTYTNKNVDTDAIYQKGYTSKHDDSNSHGLGLAKVRNILKKYKNLNLYTHKSEYYFIQELEIYK